MPIKSNLASYSAAFIGLVGGMAHYLRNRAKSELPFNLFLLFTNAFVSAFVAYTIGEALPADWQMYNNAIAGFVGFFAYPILDVAETYVIDFIKSTFDRFKKT